MTQNGTVFTARAIGRNALNELSWSYAARSVDVQAAWQVWKAPTYQDHVVCCFDSAFSDANPNSVSIGMYGGNTKGYEFLSVSSAQCPPTTIVKGATITSNFSMRGTRAVGMVLDNAVADATHYDCDLQDLATYAAFVAIKCRMRSENNAMPAFGCLVDCSLLSGHDLNASALFKMNDQGPFEVRGFDFTNATGGLLDVDFIYSDVNYQGVGVRNLPKRISGLKPPGGWTGQVFAGIAWGQGQEPYSIEGQLDWLGGGVNAFSAIAEFDLHSVRGFDLRAEHSVWVYRTNGASINGQAVSLMVNVGGNGRSLVRVASLRRQYPLTAEEIAAWSPGASKTFTVHMIRDSVTALKTHEVWLVASAHTASGSMMIGSAHTMPTFMTDDAGNPDITSDASESWTAGDLFDPNKQRLSVTFAPQKKGEVVIDVYVYLSINTTLYICPKVDVS